MPDQAFEGGIERSGAVGESNAPAVGASATVNGRRCRLAAERARRIRRRIRGRRTRAAFGNLIQYNAASGNKLPPPMPDSVAKTPSPPAPGMAPSPTTRQFNAQSRFKKTRARCTPRVRVRDAYNAVNVQIP